MQTQTYSYGTNNPTNPGHHLLQTVNGDTVNYRYDANGNRIKEQFYDPQNNLKRTINRRYDNAGRLISETGGVQQLTTYSYDTQGNLTHIRQDPNGLNRTVHYRYDARGNRTSQTITIDNITHTTSYAYNGADQLIQLTYPSGRTVDYTRNTRGQIASVATTQATTQVTTQATTISSSISYQPFGPMRAMIYGNNLVQSKTYDLDYRLTQLMTVNGNTQQDLAYTLDAANNITAINNALDTTRTQSLGYDALNRLTDATSHYGDIDYAYDALGNRLSKTIQTHTKTYTYASNTHHLEQTQGANTRTYSYDANGNTTSNTTNTFSYGDNNRLKTSGIGGSTLATYTYNGRGERVKKDSNDIIYYHYDLAGQLIAETDITGATQVEYIYLDGQPLVLITNGSIHYYHNDHLGTPQLITDSNQATVWKADYDPFGATTVDPSSTIINNLRFPGQYFDQETGNHYNINRYYDPGLGRYITSDPIGLIAGANTYNYVYGNPLRFIDPLGLKATGEWIEYAHVVPGNIDAQFLGLKPTLGLDQYITLLLMRLNFSVSGNIAASVRCKDECGKEWEMSYDNRISTNENIDLGVNIPATAGSFFYGPLVAFVLNAIIFDLKLNEGLQGLGKNLEVKATIINQAGPDLICNEGWPSI